MIETTDTSAPHISEPATPASAPSVAARSILTSAFAPIGIFDSGLGGLTVLGQITGLLPQERLIYLGDTLRCPYGPRPAEEVRQFALQVCRFLTSQQVKLIVIACNTATAVALEAAQEEFPVPIIGVINPGARAAARATRNRRIGVIGTEGTIASGAYERALLGYDAGLQVLSVATPDFVRIVEEGLSHNDDGKVWLPDEFFELAHRQLDPLVAAGIDTLVLGCTHYPILAPALQRVVGETVTLISSAQETAHEVLATLARRGNAAPLDDGEIAWSKFCTTGDTASFERLGSRIMGASISPVEKVVL
ncbi:MAG: glutamate racemase [Actinomycetia bacterium]|nr:glutamate racemase [Actinomycetes bacterium]